MASASLTLTPSRNCFRMERNLSTDSPHVSNVLPQWGSFPIWSICKYVYIHIHTHTHIHIYTYAYTYIYTYIYIESYIYIHTYIYTCTKYYTCAYEYTYIHMCIHYLYITNINTKKKLRSTHPLGRHRSSLPGDCTFSLVRRFPSWTPWWDGIGILKYVLPLKLVMK